MPGALETTVALHLNGANPAVTSLRSRAAQHLEFAAPNALFANVARLATANAGPTGAPPVCVYNGLTVGARWSGSATVIEQAKGAVAQTQADKIIAQIIRLASFDADWDGNDAAAPRASSLKDAREFIRKLAPESRMPRPTLHADGHAILFLRADDAYAELEFLENKRIGYFARRGGREWNDEFVFDGRTLPEGLLEVGFAI